MNAHGHGRVTVLAAFAESLAAPESLWDLVAAGYRVIAIARQGSSPASARIHGVELRTVPAPEQGAAATIAALDRLLQEHPGVVTLPLDDAALWLMSRLPVGPHALHVGPMGQAAEFALDKSMQVAAAQEAGWAVPATEVVEGSTPPRLRPPLVLKPMHAVQHSEGGLRRAGATMCADDVDIRTAMARLPRPLIAQQLVRGVGEGLFGHRSVEGVAAWSAHRRVRMMNPAGSGSSACESRAVDEHLLPQATVLLDALDWRGPFMIELLRDDAGGAWFIELNGRAWGSMALALGRGFRYPSWAVHAVTDEAFVPVPPLQPPPRRYRHIGREVVHLGIVVRGRKVPSPTPWPGRWETVRNLLTIESRDRVYNLRSGQLDVLAVDTWATLRAQAERMSGR